MKILCTQYYIHYYLIVRHHIYFMGTCLIKLVKISILSQQQSILFLLRRYCINVKRRLNLRNNLLLLSVVKLEATYYSCNAGTVCIRSYFEKSRLLCQVVKNYVKKLGYP